MWQAMRASSASSFLRAGPPAPCHQVGVDRHDHVAGVDQALDQHAVTGLEHHPDLGRVGLDDRDTGDERVDGPRRVLHPGDSAPAAVEVRRPSWRRSGG
jgi:hypothetical protein